MSPEEHLRRLRAPERWVPMEPAFLAPERPVAERPPLASGFRGALVTVVVLALLVVGAGTLIRLTRPADPAATTGRPPASASPSPSSAAGTVAGLPAVRGRTLATWTDRDVMPAAGTFDARGDAIAVTVTCTGGGSVAYTIVGRLAASTGCRGITTGGPETSAKDGRLVAEHRVTMRVSVKGHPRFALRLSAVPVTAVPADPSEPGVASSGPAVPASLRSCAAADVAPTATYRRWPHFEGGLVTLRSAAATDCAIRSWPALRYLNASGQQIGEPASKTWDGDSGPEAAPVRLAAHGTAYVQIELFRLDRLQDCAPERVRTLRLDVAGRHVRIPIAASAGLGKCTDPHTEADGVGNATAFAPAGP
jgi:hypothetical protein